HAAGVHAVALLGGDAAVIVRAHHAHAVEHLALRQRLAVLALGWPREQRELALEVFATLRARPEPQAAVALVVQAQDAAARRSLVRAGFGPRLRVVVLWLLDRVAG